MTLTFRGIARWNKWGRYHISDISENHLINMEGTKLPCVEIFLWSCQPWKRSLGGGGGGGALLKSEMAMATSLAIPLLTLMPPPSNKNKTKEQYNNVNVNNIIMLMLIIFITSIAVKTVFSKGMLITSN